MRKQHERRVEGRGSRMKAERGMINLQEGEKRDEETEEGDKVDG